MQINLVDYLINGFYYIKRSQSSSHRELLLNNHVRRLYDYELIPKKTLWIITWIYINTRRCTFYKNFKSENFSLPKSFSTDSHTEITKSSSLPLEEQRMKNRKRIQRSDHARMRLCFGSDICRKVLELALNSDFSTSNRKPWHIIPARNILRGQSQVLLCYWSMWQNTFHVVDLLQRFLPKSHIIMTDRHGLRTLGSSLWNLEYLYSFYSLIAVYSVMDCINCQLETWSA